MREEFLNVFFVCPTICNTNEYPTILSVSASPRLFFQVSSWACFLNSVGFMTPIDRKITAETRRHRELEEYERRISQCVFCLSHNLQYKRISNYTQRLCVSAVILPSELVGVLSELCWVHDTYRQKDNRRDAEAQRVRRI